MLRIVFFVLTVLFSQPLFSQTTANPVLVSGNKYKGVIFPEDYQVPIAFGAERLERRFTPTLAQIETAEEGFAEQYNRLRNTNVSNVSNHFKCHRRQYLGYINYKGDSIILTQLVNIGSPLALKRRRAFDRWEDYFITCLSDFCYKYLRFYHYNIDTNKLEVL